MNNHLCPKFESCSVPLCPLDAGVLKRKYLAGEPICPWLCEYSKEAARANLRYAIGGNLYETIAEVYPDIYTTYGMLKNRLDRSAQTPSRLRLVK